VGRAVHENADLGANLAAAAHLIHGSSEGRFTITYSPGHLSQQEIEGVGFRYAPLGEIVERYDTAGLVRGVNIVEGEEIFFVSNPAEGLWAHDSRFSGRGESDP